MSISVRADNRRRAAAIAAATTALVAFPAAAQANSLIQGEAFAIAPTSAGAAMADSAAESGQALVLRTTGSASKSVTLSGASNKLTVMAKRRYCNGLPQLAVDVDGKHRIATAAGNADLGYK